MNHDEFGFFNRQLAAMLRDGIPLEGSLKQLCTGMKSGRLREEIKQLEAELARGTSLKEALHRSALPEFYRRMLTIGVRTNDLPGMLTLLADHYERVNTLWTRLKGLMVYPLIVVVVSLGLTMVLSVAFGKLVSNLYEQWAPPPGLTAVGLWAPPVVLATLALLGVMAVTIPSWRARLRWRLPAFREASLAELASAMALMLRNGTTLAEALALAQTLESATPADKVLADWRARVESGEGKPTQWPAASKPIPPLFLWLVQRGGEDVASGFQKAADIYQARAAYRIELALYGALPVSILLLGLMVFWQAAPLFRSLIWLMNSVGDVGGG